MLRVITLYIIDTLVENLKKKNYNFNFIFQSL